ncbi:MAG: hypothetical protein AVDCRST_MAG73-2377, partial [uncultured Thermomicrobiales bacterium]
GVLALGGAAGPGAAAKRRVGEGGDQGPVPCGDVPGMECSEGFACVDGFCLADAGGAGGRGCAEDCKRRFGPGPARGRCVSACAQGAGEAIDEGPVPCGDVPGMECSEGFTCVDGFCLPTCGATVCGAGEFCCSETCETCAPIGGACTLLICE